MATRQSSLLRRYKHDLSRLDFCASVGLHVLHKVIGRRRISRFLSDLARPHVIGQDLSAGYAAMAADEARETEAEAWAEGLLGDVADEPIRRAR